MKDTANEPQSLYEMWTQNESTYRQAMRELEAKQQLGALCEKALFTKPYANLFLACGKKGTMTRSELEACTPLPEQFPATLVWLVKENLLKVSNDYYSLTSLGEDVFNRVRRFI